MPFVMRHSKSVLEPCPTTQPTHSSLKVADTGSKSSSSKFVRGLPGIDLEVQGHAQKPGAYGSSRRIVG